MAHSLGAHTAGRTPLNKWSARRRGRQLLKTQQTLEANNRVLRGIRTRDPSNQAAVHLRIRTHSPRDHTEHKL
jgi:hypothetical protein